MEMAFYKNHRGHRPFTGGPLKGRSSVGLAHKSKVL